jgi:hypothetical protein
LRCAVIGIEHLADIFGVDLLLDSLGVVTSVEHLEVELFSAARTPQPQDIDSVGAVTGANVVQGSPSTFWPGTHRTLSRPPPIGTCSV